MIKNLLEIDNLNIKFMSDQETVNAVRDVSITLRSGEVLGIVGESGAGTVSYTHLTLPTILRV